MSKNAAGPGCASLSVCAARVRREVCGGTPPMPPGRGPRPLHSRWHLMRCRGCRGQSPLTRSLRGVPSENTFYLQAEQTTLSLAKGQDAQPLVAAGSIRLATATLGGALEGGT